MKHSNLLSEILGGYWFIMPEAVTAHLPLIASLLEGKAIAFTEKPPLEISMAYAGHISPGKPENVRDFPKGSTAIIHMGGELTKYDGLCHYGALTYANLISYLQDQENISSLVMDIDGPGGAVNAIAPLVSAMGKFREKKPLVVHADTIASAHYYIGIHGNHLMLDNEISSMAGSIGVVYQFADVSKRLEDMGVKLRSIYPKESSHKNLPYEEMKEGNDEPMKEKFLSPLAQKFQNTVKSRRGDKLDLSVEGLLNGAMFFSADAKRYGLVDSIGDLAQSVELANSLVEARNFMTNY